MSPDDCYDKAVDLLARRPHFRRALERKLSARGFESSEIEAACERLAASGLLDDLASARGLVEGRWRRRGYGPLRIRAELERRGVESSIIDSVLRENSGDETDVAEQTARRWLGRTGGTREALARHLGRKGYARATVYRVLERLRDELGDG